LKLENQETHSLGVFFSLGVNLLFPCGTVQNPHFFSRKFGYRTANRTNLFEAREKKQFEVAISPNSVEITIR
jgi:hypothetical protein